MRVLELHARLKVIQRSKGQSAVAAAAYRSASCLYDERTGQFKDYTDKKPNVEHVAIFLPDNAPDWAHDRAGLWNAAEKKENRSNSQTARELEISFPHEMSAQQRRQAGYQVSQMLVERYGAAVDIAFHHPSGEGDQRNHHAHLMFTVRRFDPATKDGWAKKKDRVLDDRSFAEGQSVSKGQQEVSWLRENVAARMNEISAQRDLGVFVEHLSFKQRGLDRDPTSHMGPSATDMERNGKKTHIGNMNRLIEETNVLYLEVEREKRRVANEQRRAEGKAEVRRSALQRREAFYQAKQQERAYMLEAQERQHGVAEKQLRLDLQVLHESTQRQGWFGFVRFWHNVTGRRAEELREITTKQGEFDRIQADKAAQRSEFEQRRVVELGRLKHVEAAREAAQAQERKAPALPAKKPANEHHSVREKAEAKTLSDREQRLQDFKDGLARDRDKPDRDLDR